MKKITISATIEALKNNFLLGKDVKVISRSLDHLRVVYHKCIIDFDIIGTDRHFIGFTIEGFANYIVCEELINIMKALERSVND